MSARLCEGCDKELVGKRRGAKVHDGTCRKRKQRRLRRELARAQSDQWPPGFERAEEALVSLIHKRIDPDRALARIALAWPQPEREEVAA